MITFRQFDKSDWEAFSGCESKTPKIAEFGETFALIVDGSRVELVDAQETGTIVTVGRTFKLPTTADHVAQALVDAYETLDYHLWVAITHAALQADYQ